MLFRSLRVKNAVLILGSNSQVSGVPFFVTVKPKWESRRGLVVACTMHCESGVWSWGRLRGGAGRKENLTYLSGCIDNLGGIVLVLVLDHFAKSVLNGGIVAVDEVAVDELHRHTRLACAEGNVSMLLAGTGM